MPGIFFGLSDQNCDVFRQKSKRADGELLFVEIS